MPVNKVCLYDYRHDVDMFIFHCLHQNILKEQLRQPTNACHYTEQFICWLFASWTKYLWWLFLYPVRITSSIHIIFENHGSHIKNKTEIHIWKNVLHTQQITAKIMQQIPTSIYMIYVFETLLMIKYFTYLEHRVVKLNHAFCCQIIHNIFVKDVCISVLYKNILLLFSLWCVIRDMFL